jgi:hypothetical protein
MDLVKRVYKQGLILIIPIAIISSFLEWKKLPLSIIIGALLGFANLKGLAWGIERFFGPYKPSGKLIFLSIIRFFILTCILFILALLKIINFIGLLIGFTVIFFLIIKEGLRVVKESSNKEGGIT